MALDFSHLFDSLYPTPESCFDNSMSQSSCLLSSSTQFADRCTQMEMSESLVWKILGRLRDMMDLGKKLKVCDKKDTRLPRGFSEFCWKGMKLWGKTVICWSLAVPCNRRRLMARIGYYRRLESISCKNSAGVSLAHLPTFFKLFCTTELGVMWRAMSRAVAFHQLKFSLICSHLSLLCSSQCAGVSTLTRGFSLLSPRLMVRSGYTFLLDKKWILLRLVEATDDCQNRR